MAGSINAEQKAAREREALWEFASRRGEVDKWGEVASRPVPEPDLLCHHTERGRIAFEVVHLVDGDVAQALNGKWPDGVFSTADPTSAIIRSKLGKQYRTSFPIELLVCWDGRLITPDDVVLDTLRSLLTLHSHPFRRVWYLGESVCVEVLPA
jgi:hypothetical protein